MATAIRDLDVALPPPGLALETRYDRCLLVLRAQGRPVGQLRVRLAAGALEAGELERALVEAGSWPLGRAWIDAFLGGGETAPPAPPATVAVCTRDRADDLGRCLASLAGLPDDGQEILVVDSASRGGETASVVARHPGCRYLRSERPGLDVARNLALGSARHDLVAFVDDDARVESGWLRALLAPFAEDPRCLVSTGLVLPAELESEAQEWFEQYYGFGRGFEPRIFDSGNVPLEQAWRCGVGAAMAVRREEIRARLGGFDEALDAGTPTHGGGDNDLFARVLAAGATVHYRPDAVAWHRHGASSRAVRAKFYGYGVSWVAFLRRLGTREGYGRVWLELPRALARQAGRIGRSLAGRADALPARLLVAEAAGWLAGPLADLRASRAHRSPRGAASTSAPAPAAVAPLPDPSSDPIALRELDLELDLEAARADLDRAPVDAALLRWGARPIGLLAAPAGGWLAPADLERALRGPLALELLSAWAESGRPPARPAVPGWWLAALGRWFERLAAPPPAPPDGPYIERFLAQEDAYRHLQAWIARRQEDKDRLTAAERSARARAAAAAEELAALDLRLAELESRRAAARRRRAAEAAG